MSDDRKWCWGYLDAEHVSGPFDTWQEAVADAKREVIEKVDAERQKFLPQMYMTHEVQVNIGRCNLADPSYYAAAVTDLDDLIERMEEHYVDNECYCDDSVFEVTDSRAEKVLKEVMRKWAKKYLKATFWCMADEEKITIQIDEEE